MNTIKATGSFTDPAAAPTLLISPGRGNLDDRVEVHIAMRDTGEESTRVLQGWFPAAELENALAQAREESARSDGRRRLTEPVREDA